jgi:hypothetical protein
MEGVKWIHLAQKGPVADSCNHGNERLGYKWQGIS